MISKYNIYLCKDGRYEGRINIGRKEDGQILYRSLYDDNAERLKKRMEEEYQKQRKSLLESGPTFEVLFQHWLEEKSKKVRKSTLSIYRCYIDSHLMPLLRGEFTSKMTAEKLERLCDEGLYRRKDGKGDMAVKSRIDLLRTLNSILRFGTKYGYMEHLLQLEYPKAGKKNINVLREREQSRLEQCLRNDFSRREALGIYICLYTGLRVGELCGLQWGDIDLEYGILFVRRTVQRITTSKGAKKTEILIGPPKSSGSLREIPLPDHLLLLLKQLNKAADHTYFLSNTKHCFEPRRMQRAFTEYLEKAGIPRRGFHCTRHTFATRWVELGADIKTLSEILGHNSIQITLDKYVHISEKTKRENINKIQPLCAENVSSADRQNLLLIPHHAGDLKPFVVNV